MKVSEIMTKQVATIPADFTLIETAKFLAERKISGAPVINKEGKLEGIISEKDLFKALYPSHAEFYETPGVWLDLDKLEESTAGSAHKSIKDFMSRQVVTVNKDTSVMQVGSMMLVRGIHRIVIVSQENNIEGIVTRQDIYKTILKDRLKI